MKLLGLLTALTFIGYSAEPVTGPISGIVLLRDSGSVRLIQGLPGAALLGPAIAAPEGLRITAIQAEAGIAAGSLNGVPVLLRGLRNSAVETTPLKGLATSPDLLAAKGDYAAAYSSEDRKLLWIENTRSVEPAMSVLLEDATVAALAVSASGRLLVAVTSAEGTTLHASSRGATLTRIANFDGAVALAFTTSENALVADSARSEVFSLSPSGELQLVAAARDGVDQPVAVASLGAATLIANAASRTLQILEAGQIQTLDLPITPDRLELVGLNGAFKLNNGAPAVQYLFDAANRSVFFIPAETAINE
jgi:hypothetical protein